jgi:hypothetical protein
MMCSVQTAGRDGKMKKTKTSDILKRLTALMLAVLMALGTLSDYTEVFAYTSDVASGSTAVADLGGTSSSDWSGFQREGPYIAVTPIHNDSIENSLTVNDLSTDAEDAGDETIENSFRAERYVDLYSILIPKYLSIYPLCHIISCINKNSLAKRRYDYEKYEKIYNFYNLSGTCSSIYSG